MQKTSAGHSRRVHPRPRGQLRATEKAKEEKEAHGEIETAHPGYLGAQDPSTSGR